MNQGQNNCIREKCYMGKKVTGRNVTLGKMLQWEKCYREKRYRENCYRENCLGGKRYTSVSARLGWTSITSFFSQRFWLLKRKLQNLNFLQFGPTLRPKSYYKNVIILPFDCLFQMHYVLNFHFMCTKW